jgi:hypothetical protein
MVVSPAEHGSITLLQREQRKCAEREGKTKLILTASRAVAKPRADAQVAGGVQRAQHGVILVMAYSTRAVATDRL